MSDPRANPLTLAELQAKRADILRIAATHGATNVRVFGSVARGEARAGSDIDFLVDLAPGRTLFDLIGLILDLQEALGCKVDVVERWPVSPVARRAQREGVKL